MHFAKWIKPVRNFGDICPTYTKVFAARLGENATLTITALGCYEVMLNGERVGDYVLTPGWTETLLFRGGGGRLQFQEYDVSHLLKGENKLEITVGRGWCRSPLAGWRGKDGPDPRLDLPPALIALLKTATMSIETDETWQAEESCVNFSEIYDGEIYDARRVAAPEPVKIFPPPNLTLIPNQGEDIREMEKILPLSVFSTPNGESVVDFGQNITGYIEFSLPETTRSGTEINISFAEVLDADGNFYTENYRTAKSELHYICKNGAQTYKPKFTFFGFRYIKTEGAFLQNLKAIAVYSDMERTGWLTCANPLLNKFFDNVAWGQKGNFLDVPTDCPQRDERLGWTGDAQVFIKTAALFFDVEKFFTKWLADLAIAQTENGSVPHVVPDTQQGRGGSAAWGDAATICPWELYLAYGNSKILQLQFDSMCRWVDFITSTTKNEYEWTGGTHFGDWLSLELPAPEVNPDIRRGATRHDFLATAFYAHSVSLVVKAGEVLGRDVSSYKNLYKNICHVFQKYEGDYRTQTEYILALQFGLTKNPQAIADALAKKITADGSCLKTGFVGTPYILHVLSRYGYTELAYTLLLREHYPSWLYPVTKGATTIWERWDSIKPDGSFQTANMNSFNHYAYGAAADWVYTVAAGITMAKPGYARIKIAPQPDSRIPWLNARLKTRRGTIISNWQYVNNVVQYSIQTPCPTEIHIGDEIYNVNAGLYTFFGGIKNGIEQ